MIDSYKCPACINDDKSKYYSKKKGDWKQCEWCHVSGIHGVLMESSHGGAVNTLRKHEIVLSTSILPGVRTTRTNDFMYFLTVLFNCTS